MAKYQRVIHILADGRRKYSTHHGKIEQWSEAEVAALRSNLAERGCAAFTLDFSRYDPDYRRLRERFPGAPIIKVIGCETEDHDLPLNPEIIY